MNEVRKEVLIGTSTKISNDTVIYGFGAYIIIYTKSHDHNIVKQDYFSYINIKNVINMNLL